MEIRTLNESDAASYWELRLRALRKDPWAFSASFEENRTIPIETIVHRFRERWNSPENVVLGAFVAGQLVGTVGLYREQSEKLRHKGGIWGMYVAPEARGQGVGKALLSEAIARARLLPGLELVNIGVTTRQTVARRLYQSMGFIPYGFERSALRVGGEYWDEEHLVLPLAEPSTALIEQIKSLLNLGPLPAEGGYYAESYRAQDQVPASALPPRYQAGRSLGTAIYYLLTPDTFSALHRLLTDEVYHFYLGDPVEMLQLWPDGSGKVLTLGQDIFNGMQVQTTVPRGVWQGSRLAPGGQFALLGTTMAPGFDPADFDLGQRLALLDAYPDFCEWITALTSGGGIPIPPPQ